MNKLEVCCGSYEDAMNAYHGGAKRIELNSALNCLSDIEQAVIFLLFKKELSQAEAAEILEIYSKTVSKIKIRAIEKMRKYMKGDCENEK